MGNPFTDISRTFRKFDVKKPAQEVFNIREFQEVFVEIIQDRLETKGIDALGNILKTNRAEGLNVYGRRTITMKRKKGQKIKNVTLKDTGDFYRNWRIKMSAFIIELEANFKKDKGDIYDNFTRKYDTPQTFYAAVLSMNNNELIHYSINVILPTYVEFIKKDLGAKIESL